MEPFGPYDPDRGPDPEAWLALEQAERVEAIERWADGAAHTPAAATAGKLPNRRVYAVMLATVETQVARGDELPVSGALERLVRLGMSRREAVHALATVLAETTYDAFYGEVAGDPEAWRNRFDDDLALPVF